MLAKKAYERPARLVPSDLDPLRALAGDGALDYLLVIAAFHFVNRIADLLDVDPEAIPERLRRFESLRRLAVRLASLWMAKMDLASRVYPLTYEEALTKFGPLCERATGRPTGDAFAPLRSRPKLIEAVLLALEERDARSSLDRQTLARVHGAVEAALPASIDDIEGLHPRPSDPVEAFAFVGTRYAYRASADMIDALRRRGYDDLRILDLAIAIADANQWARLHRLAGLAPDLYYLSASEDTREPAPAVA